MEPEDGGDIKRAVVTDHDIEKRIQAHMHNLVASTSPVDLKNTPTQTLLDQPPSNPNPNPNSGLVQWTVLGILFADNTGKEACERKGQNPWVMVSAKEQTYSRIWNEKVDAVADYERKPDTKVHFGPYVKLVSWDSVGMCIKNGLAVEQTTDPVQLTIEQKQALKHVLLGEEDPAVIK